LTYLVCGRKPPSDPSDGGDISDRRIAGDRAMSMDKGVVWSSQAMAGCALIPGRITRVGYRSKVVDGGVRGPNDNSDDPENVEEGVGGVLGITGGVRGAGHKTSFVTGSRNWTRFPIGMAS